MKILQVRPYALDLSLTPPDCAVLASACHVAAQHLVAPHEEQQRAHLDALAVAFESLGTVGEALFALPSEILADLAAPS